LATGGCLAGRTLYLLITPNRSEVTKIDLEQPNARFEVSFAERPATRIGSNADLLKEDCL
jgi:hypothetical protein